MSKELFHLSGPVIAPSLLSADQLTLLHEVRDAEKSGIQWLHVDVMDGQFVPNLTFGVPLVSALRKVTNCFLDCHLMVHEPAKMIPWFQSAGADGITIHAEATANLAADLTAIRSAGCMVGVSIKPNTDVHMIESVLPLVDMVLVMSVYPGFSGQKFMPEVLDKVRELVRIRTVRGLKFRIQIDGGIGKGTIRESFVAGAEIFVAGNAFYAANDRAAASAELVQAALGQRVGGK